jgi:hypothetical protein
MVTCFLWLTTAYMRLVLELHPKVVHDYLGVQGSTLQKTAQDPNLMIATSPELGITNSRCFVTKNTVML